MAHTKVASVTLDFRAKSAIDAVDDPIREDLSACAIHGSCLWVACDETTTVERIATTDWQRFDRHTNFDFSTIFNLPTGNGEEIDIEGLSVCDGFLWIVGSHSIKREKPKRHESDAGKALARLNTITREANRHFLGRVPLVATHEAGVHDAAARDVGAHGSPGDRVAACLPMFDGRNVLTDALSADPQLGPFLGIPCKENGLDIEGIAVRGHDIFLGLRGPVLRGWATVLHLRLQNVRDGRLELATIGPNEELYRRQFIDLDGLGIRDLTFDGDDLLILAGPTMDLDGPVRLHRWPTPYLWNEEDVITQDRVRCLMDLPFGEGVDHAEGIDVIRRSGTAPMLLVVFDSPAPERLHANGTAIDADLFPLPE